MKKNNVENIKFTKYFNQLDNCLIAVDEEIYEDIHGEKFTTSKIKELLDSYDYSWDGEIYWMPKEWGEKFIIFLHNWFEKKEVFAPNDLDENGVCFLTPYMKTKNGYAFINPLLDSGATELSEAYDDFLKLENNQDIENEIMIINNCHLIDKIKIDAYNKNESLEYIFLFNEGLINDSLFFYSDLTELPKDKEIVLTGVFFDVRKDLITNLKNRGFKIKNSITSENDWLWVGDKCGKNKLDAAKKMGVKISNIEDLLNLLLTKKLTSKNKIC